MTRRARAALFALSVAWLLPFGTARMARADTAPSVWDRARDPSVGPSYRLHLEAQRRLARVEPLFDLGFGFSAPHESQKDTVRAMLERVGADKSPDVRLRFDLGLVYLLLGKTEGRTYFGRAAEVLKGALALAPDHPAAEEAWSRLAEACGHIGDHDCERRAYDRVLALTTEEADRGTSTLNLAETSMHLGDLDEAIEGYREALRIASRSPSRTLAPLAIWGLAVALDRSGDRAGADKQALAVIELQASSAMGNLLRSPGVFFYPEYELRWYDGVGACALARRASTSPTMAARYWRAAEDAFAAYVQAAQRSGATDRWLELAKLRHAAAKAAREAADRRPRAPSRPGPEDDGEPLF